ncbi:MAG TPA: hypothetical protein IAA43_08925 [Candidatus Olsenella avicola]|uniref:hypothetical protein n=1 Tax=Olsenella sp. An285 TaxID=1965621 RepID=UPI000B37DAF2|nr:hypothetical protein [Olsenella sp. An285]OUO48220.1 hypothetical protein B5F79_02415 [Olsenella sp. An285]HIY52045.1 hypothetical protein [Candidatus Olsenella avicola]
MGSRAKTLVAGVVLILAAIVVAGGIALGPGLLAGSEPADNESADQSQELTTVHGVIGSEKESLFADPEAKEIFARYGLDVQVTTSGSWAMAERAGIEQEDFASPSSEVAAAHLTDVHGDAVLSTTRPFYSPLAIATGSTVLDVLAANGLAEQRDGVWYLDMAAYLDAVANGRRWTDLAGSEAYPSSRNVMITSTDVRSSNSALMYLSLASYVLNGNAVVTSEDAAREQAMASLARLFLDQGYSQSSSAGPWESFLSKGPMNQPLTLIYESQYLEAQMNEPTRVTDEMRICYPDPTIFSDHVVVAFSEAGQRVQDVLDNDPDMARVIARHGFRVNGANSGAFSEQISQAGLTGYAADGTFIDAAQAPSYEVADAMLQTIEALY